MTCMAAASAPPSVPSRESATMLARLARRAGIAALLVLVFLGANELRLATQSSGAALRGDLVAAAQVVHALPMTATPERARLAVERALAGRSASVDAMGFPVVVAVTLHGLDRPSCIEAVSEARRIDGLTVIELRDEGYPAACGELNDMTWRLLP